MQASIWLTREHVAEILDTFNTVVHDDASLEGMALLGDPDTMKVAEWDMHPDAHPFIAR